MRFKVHLMTAQPLYMTESKVEFNCKVYFCNKRFIEYDEPF